jgi:beta-aspartyl-peptidase (threonine type)
MNKPASALVLFLFTIFAGMLSGQVQHKAPVSSSDAEVAISAVLRAQVEAWGRGDLEGFMAGYWHSKDLTFMSNSDEARGWEETLHRYRQRYQYGGNQMGKLAMSWYSPIHLLGQDAAYVSGKWQLSMPDGGQPHGSFTLIFRRFHEGWRIVHDHTCAD